MPGAAFRRTSPASSDGRVARGFGAGSFRLRQYVLEFIRMLAVGDVDGESSGNSCELARSGIWHHGYDEVRNATIHGSRVLEDESAGAAVQGPAHFLNRHVSGRALYLSHP